jgi:hypothetical protein
VSSTCSISKILLKGKSMCAIALLTSRRIRLSKPRNVSSPERSPATVLISPESP